MECRMDKDNYDRYPLPGETYNPNTFYRFWPLPDELTGGYTPNGSAMCKSGTILVCLWNYQVHKRSLGNVLKLSLGGVKLFDKETDKNRPLFICPTYITENGNEDICVSDVNAVVVTDAGGFLRFRYTGTQSDPQFDPYGICCDSKNNIIVADMVKNRIHMIDQNGELLHFIQYQGMHMPRALCINKHNILYVGEWLSEEIKVLSLQ
ncbi:protein lin-41-like [Saccostrea cucullata]|uniref:protein lin-41-like n=1 Tax=Saccostrea cuccullata TaxID=36930 RepID=UPI002ED06F1A